MEGGEGTETAIPGPNHGPSERHHLGIASLPSPRFVMLSTGCVKDRGVFVEKMGTRV